MIGVFHGCGLESITIPLTVKEIGEDTFRGCTDLASMQLHEGVQKIDAGAFRGCELEYITIPSTVKEIREDPFKGCTELASVQLHEGT